jgi:hypothetical protein
MGGWSGDSDGWMKRRFGWVDDGGMRIEGKDEMHIIIVGGKKRRRLVPP